MSQKRIQIDILLVEDNEDDVLLIKEAFRALDHVRFIGIVNDGRAALAFLRKTTPYQSAPTPHFVLLDLNMPVMSGFDVLREMKRDPELREIPVVILTTSDRDEDVSRTFAEGACSFISKPANPGAYRRLAEQFEWYWTRASRLPGIKPSRR